MGQPTDKPSISPAMVRRIYDMARIAALDPRMGSPLGLMRVRGEIDDIEMAAGLRFAGECMRYLAAYGLSATARAQDVNRVQGKSTGEEDPRVKVAYHASYTALLDIGDFAHQVAFDLCVMDREQTLPAPKKMAPRALDALAVHYGLRMKRRYA
jgi:hypothetical protein